MFMSIVLVPTCQVRAFRFYQRWFLLPSSSFSSGSIGSCNCERQILVGIADLNWELQISVGTARPQPRVPDLSGHCRTSTASARSQWALPGLNHELQISVADAGPQLRAPDLSAQGHWDLALAVEVRQCPCQRKCQKECQIERQKACHHTGQKECQHICQKVCQNRCQRMSEYMLERERMSEYVWAFVLINVTRCIVIQLSSTTQILEWLNHQIPSAPNQCSQSSLLQLVKPPPLVAKTLALINPKLVFWHLHQNLYLDPHVHWLNDQTG